MTEQDEQYETYRRCICCCAELEPVTLMGAVVTRGPLQPWLRKCAPCRKDRIRPPIEWEEWC